MIDPAQIPDEAVEAAAKRLFESSVCFLRNQEEIPDWDAAPNTLKEVFRDEASACIAAALSAWPGAYTDTTFSNAFTPDLILPLPDGAEEVKG